LIGLVDGIGQGLPVEHVWIGQHGGHGDAAPVRQLKPIAAQEGPLGARPHRALRDVARNADGYERFDRFGHICLAPFLDGDAQPLGGRGLEAIDLGRLLRRQVRHAAAVEDLSLTINRAPGVLGLFQPLVQLRRTLEHQALGAADRPSRMATKT
jgi:hypothetical protein